MQPVQRSGVMCKTFIAVPHGLAWSVEMLCSARTTMIRPGAEVNCEHSISMPRCTPEGAVEYERYFFCAWVGTGRPGIFTFTAPRWVRLVKYSVFQSSPP